MVTLNDYLIASGLLFAIGFAGVLLRRNVIIIFMALELMLNAANLSLIGFSRYNVHDGLPDYNGQVLAFFIITVAAAEVTVGLAIIVALFRAKQTTQVEDITTLKFYGINFIPWIILFAPFVSALVIGLVTERSKKLSSYISVAAVALSFVFSLGVFFSQDGSAGFNWIDLGVFQVQGGYLINGLNK